MSHKGENVINIGLFSFIFMWLECADKGYISKEETFYFCWPPWSQSFLQKVSQPFVFRCIRKKQAWSTQMPMYHSPVDINCRSLWNNSSQEQEKPLWGAGVHMDCSALYEYAGSFPADFQAASYPFSFRWKLMVVFLFWSSPWGVIARRGDLSVAY